MLVWRNTDRTKIEIFRERKGGEEGDRSKIARKTNEASRRVTAKRKREKWVSQQIDIVGR